MLPSCESVYMLGKVAQRNQKCSCAGTKAVSAIKFDKLTKIDFKLRDYIR